MSEKPEKKRRQDYEAPAIVFEEEVEAVAAACTSSFTPSTTCRYSAGPCDSILN